MAILYVADRATSDSFAFAVGSDALVVDSLPALMRAADEHPEEVLVVVGPDVDLASALQFTEANRVHRPHLGVVLARRRVDVTMLAQALRAGVREVVNPDDLRAVADACRRSVEVSNGILGAAADGPVFEGKVVTVFSAKGGCGKTTMATNLALSLAAGGAHTVCIVDLDLAFGDVAITMQLFPTHSIEHAIGSEHTLDAELLNGLLTRHQDSLMILAAPSHPDVRDRISPTLVSQVLRTLKESFDFIVVDTAPAFDEQTLTALDETDEILIIATLDVPTLKNVKVALETLDMLNIAQDRRHLLLNRADDEVGIGADRVEAILGMRPAAKVATSLEVAAATNAGNPIVAKNPYHPTSTAIITLASQLAGEEIATPPAATGEQTADTDQQPKRRLRRRR
jgi:pilus assembly protein CpaE